MSPRRAEKRVALLLVTAITATLFLFAGYKIDAVGDLHTGS